LDRSSNPLQGCRFDAVHHHRAPAEALSEISFDIVIKGFTRTGDTMKKD
jgi:hypothetical protein